MAINITDGFNLTFAAPIDYRMVTTNSSTLSTMAASASIYKYNGLKVTRLDNRLTYMWNGSAFVLDNPTMVTGTGSINYVPKVTGVSPYLVLGNSVIYDNGGGVGIGTNDPKEVFQIGSYPPAFVGLSLPLTFHKGGNTVIAYNWYYNGTDQYFDTTKGSVQLYFNGTTGDMAIRNRPSSGVFADTIYFASNNQVLIKDGSAALPSLGFINSPNSGIYSPGGNIVSISSAGTQRFRIFPGAATDMGLISPTGAKTLNWSLYDSGYLPIALSPAGGTYDFTGFDYIYYRGTFSVTGTNWATAGDTSTIQIGDAGHRIQSTYGGPFKIRSLDNITLGNTTGDVSALTINNTVTGNKITISPYDIFVNIHNTGTNGIGDSGNNVSPWGYPSLASGQFTLISGDVTSLVNCSSFIPRPCAWHRTGNIVTVSGQVSFTVTTANVDTSFKLKIPIKSVFGVDTGGGDGNNWQLSGVGKIVSKYGSAGDVVTIQAYATSTAQFKFKPSSTGAQTMTYHYTYIVGTWPDTSGGGGGILGL